jgi:hypothetical protein
VLAAVGLCLFLGTSKHRSTLTSRAVAQRKWSFGNLSGNYTSSHADKPAW